MFGCYVATDVTFARFTTVKLSDDPACADPNDTDGDGYPNNDDCAPEDPNLPSTMSCDDYCGQWEMVWFEGAGTFGSPIVIPLGTAADIRLTNAFGGVLFDINGGGRKERVSWTEAGSNSAWLALDRNGNATIDSGNELFGNFTAQPASPGRNGFSALKVFDDPARGGNGDGWIDSADVVFASLRLWQDANHDGVSQASELVPLADSGVSRL